MIEIVFHARGGQGAVTASQILATAAFYEGKQAQAFPSFGVERRGAPVTAYTRIDERPIVDRSIIVKADYVLVLAPSILKTSNPLGFLKERGCAVLNVTRSHTEFETSHNGIRVFCIDASRISEQVYGKRSIPITNVSMLGALVSATGIVQLDSILDAVDQSFSGETAENARKTARMAHDLMADTLAGNQA